MDQLIINSNKDSIPKRKANILPVSKRISSKKLNFVGVIIQMSYDWSWNFYACTENNLVGPCAKVYGDVRRMNFCIFLSDITRVLVRPALVPSQLFIISGDTWLKGSLFNHIS